MSRFSIFRRIFFSHSAYNFRRGILYCCGIFGQGEKFGYEVGGVSTFSVENFFSHSAENIRR